MTFKSIGSNGIGRYFETLDFQPFLKIGLTFAYLKALENFFKDTERLQISVSTSPRTSAPSFRNLPGSLSMAAAFWVLISL